MVDLISREAALKEAYKIVIDGDVYDVVQVETLMALPNVERKGHWENYLKEGLKYKCSVCGSRYNLPWNYCPNCGAKNGGCK